MASPFSENLRKLLPYLITIILLVVIFQRVSITATFEHFHGRKIWELVVFASFFYIYTFFANSFSYYILFHQMKRPINFWEILSIRGASYLLTALNSGVGQGGMALWVSRKKSMPIKEVISMMLMFPVVDMTFMAIMLSISLLLHCLGTCVLPPVHANILYWALLAMWSILIIHYSLWLTGFLPKHSRFFRESALLCAYRNAGVKNYLALLGARTLINFPGMLAYYTGLKLFGVVVPFWFFVVRFFPTLVIQGLPITIGQLGTSQTAWILMYKDLANPEKLNAFSLLWITVYNLSRIIIGAIFFRGEAKFYFEKIRAAERDGKKAAPSE